MSFLITKSDSDGSDVAVRMTARTEVQQMPLARSLDRRHPRAGAPGPLLDESIDPWPWPLVVNRKVRPIVHRLLM